MEMTTDEIIRNFQETIKIIHKYQKIQEIVEYWACRDNPSYISTISMVAISEVLEDGKDCDTNEEE